MNDDFVACKSFQQTVAMMMSGGSAETPRRTQYPHERAMVDSHMAPIGFVGTQWGAARGCSQRSIRGIIASMRGFIDTLGGLWELLLLAWKTRFRLRGKYWLWRRETAFGVNGNAVPWRDRCRAILAYGRWVWRTKRGR